MKKLIFCLCMCLIMPFCANAAENITLPQLKSLLEQNRGKVVMLNFFATWCPPCRVELPELVKLREDYPQDKLMIIGLSVDENAAPVESFIKNAGVNYPVYIAGQEITDSYNISSVPHNAFFAPDGSLIISEPGMAETSVLKRVVNDLMKDK